MWNSTRRQALRHDTKSNAGVALFSCVLGFLIPTVIGLYWPIYSVSPGLAVGMLRPCILAVSLLLALFWYYAPVTAAELRGACLLGLLTAALLAPSLAAADAATALVYWLKLLVLCGIALLLCRALRHERTAKSLGAGLVLAGVIVGAFTVFTYVRFMGFALPTYKSTRIFKGIAEAAGVPLNAIPFTSVFSFLAGMCLVRTTRLLRWIGFALFLISCVFTGSRAPVGALLVSALLLLMLNAFRSRHLLIRASAYLLTAVAPLGIAALLWSLPFKRMSSLTEGRWDLWFVACRKFIAQPLIGSGYNSWQHDVASMLPGDYHLTAYLSKHLIGGYHNEYLSLLAEQGLVGFVPAMILVWFLFSLAWKSAFCRWSTFHNGQWALFACLFLLVRAMVEIPGLFGDGNEPADFLAYIFVAIMISRFSIEEDFLRSTSTSSSWNAPAVPVASGSTNEWTNAAGVA